MDTNSIMAMLEDKLPKDSADRALLCEKLDKASKAKREELVKNLPFLKLKNPAFVFWVGSFLLGWFGIGRFMVGDILLGALRLGLYISTIIALYRFYWVDYTEWWIAVGLNIAMPIWWVVDLFLTGKKLRKKNLDKIIQFLQ